MKCLLNWKQHEILTKETKITKISNTTTQYSCFICGGPNHKIYDHLHQQATLEMFKNKKTNFAPKKENVIVNMVLVVTTRNQVPKANAFKEKETKQEYNKLAKGTT